MYFICVASFTGLLPPSHAMLCVRISSSALKCARALLTVEGEGLGTCYIALIACARARRTVSHTPRSHTFVAEALGNPLAEILASYALASFPGLPRGEKAWYTLFAHALNFPRNSVSRSDIPVLVYVTLVYSRITFRWTRWTGSRKLWRTLSSA